MRRPAAVIALAVMALAATPTCVPALGPGDALVTSTRILAVRADPAEASPGSLVAFTSLVASPGGTVSGARIAWSFCTAPAPLTDDNVVSNACLGSASLVAAGAGPESSADTPSDGCSVFGPDVGSAGVRPRDPDATGGYYQPLRADLPGADAAAFFLTRIRCDLANATAAQATAFAAAYQPNQNPELLPLTATLGGAPVALDAVPPGAQVSLEASWRSASAETFGYFDPVSQTLTTQREAMQVAWYADAGQLGTESTGRAGTDLATSTTNTWTAPSAASSATLWIVLRDSRGGVAFESVAARVNSP